MSSKRKKRQALTSPRTCIGRSRKLPGGLQEGRRLQSRLSLERKSEGTACWTQLTLRERGGGSPGADGGRAETLERYALHGINIVPKRRRRRPYQTGRSAKKRSASDLIVRDRRHGETSAYKKLSFPGRAQGKKDSVSSRKTGSGPSLGTPGGGKSISPLPDGRSTMGVRVLAQGAEKKESIKGPRVAPKSIFQEGIEKVSTPKEGDLRPCP